MDKLCTQGSELELNSQTLDCPAGWFCQKVTKDQFHYTQLAKQLIIYLNKLSMTDTNTQKCKYKASHGKLTNEQELIYFMKVSFIQFVQQTQIYPPPYFFISVALSYCNIMDKELLEPIRHHVSLFFVGSVTNVGHQVLALEATAYSVVNTLGFTPVRLKQKMYYSCGHLITETW